MTTPALDSTRRPLRQVRPSSILRSLLAVAVLIVAACSPAATGAPSSGNPTPSLPASASPAPSGPTGTLTIGLSADAESMDPYRVYQNAGFSVMYAIFDTLVTIAPAGTLGPGLADSWTSPDSKSLTLKLHPGVKFQDGEPFDAAAVRFSLYRIADIDPGTNKPYPVGDSRRLNSAFASNYGSLDSVEVVGPLTVTLHLNRPDSGLLGNLGTLQMVPPQYFAQVGNAGFALKPVGTGPFTFVEWTKDDHITLAANPNYWNSPRGKALVARVIFRPIPDVATRMSELTTGGIQIMQDLPPDQAAQVKAAGDKAVYLSDAHSLAIWLTTDKGGNLARNPGDQATAIAALANPAVRRALNMAIDRKTLVSTILDGYGEPMNSLWVSGDKGYDASLPAIAFDPTGAKQILTQQGYPNGFSVNMDTCTCDNSAIYEAVVGMLANIGVQVTLKPAELTQFNDAWGKGATNPMRGARLGFPVDPNTELYLWVYSGGYLSRYKDPQVDALINQQAGLPADDYGPARVAILRQIAAQAQQDPPAIFLVGQGSLYGTVGSGLTWAPNVQGYISVTGVSYAP
jgi:peptide/nickel transport system substrate-binding protein